MASKLSSDTVDILSCSRCSRQYTSYSAYARHQKSHDHNRFYSCDICNLKFSRSDVLRRHKLVHGETNRNNRQRSIRACDNCRQSKIRCNNGDPCHHCIKSGKKCSYLMKSIRPSVQGFPVNSEGVTYNLPSSTGANAPLLQDNTSLPPSQASANSFGSSSTADLEQWLLPPPGASAASWKLLENMPTAASSFHDHTGASNVEAPQSERDKTTHTRHFNANASLAHLGNMSGQAESAEFGLSDVDICSFDPSRDHTSAENQNALNQSENIAVNVNAPLAHLCNTPTEAQPAEFGLSDIDIYSLETIREQFSLEIQNAPHQSEIFVINEEASGVFREIVQEAVDDFTQFPAHDAVFRSQKRRALSQLFDACFDLSNNVPNKSTHVLHSFITFFFEKFYHMWPISWRQGFDYDAVEPFLYLTMTSIGAIYADTSHARAYGMAMHQSLCPILLNVCLTCPENEVKLDQIFEALLLTAIMSLHLGHPRTSKYVHQASAVLVSHARRIRLFRETPDHPISDLGSSRDHHQSEKSLAQWIKLERRRRLAFAFLRWEVFSSILLNTRPLISYEELRLRIPCSQERWTYIGPDWREKLLTARQEAAFYPLYAHMVHTVSDGSLGNLPALSASAHELILYGLHVSLGTFSSDIDIGRSDVHQSLQPFAQWKTSQGMLKPPSSSHRKCSSAWLLYHLAYIRIHSNLEILEIYARCETPADPYQERNTQKIVLWATTGHAKVALHHACQIWYLIQDSLEQTYRNRSNAFSPSPSQLKSDSSILAVIALYYAGIIMRTMADLCPEIGPEIWQAEHFGGELCLTSYNIHGEVNKLGVMASRLSPSWKEVSSLILDIEALSQRKQPITLL